MNILTFQELFSVVKNTILTYSNKITPATVETTGTNVNTIAGTIAFVSDVLMQKMVNGLRSINIITATGDDLDSLGYGWYGATRLSATPSYTTVTFSRTDTTNDLNILSGTELSTSDGILFTTTEDTTIAVGTASGDVSVVSSMTGSDMNVGSGTITVITNPGLFPNDVVVTNSTAAIGGTDDETDTDYRTRLQNFWKNAQRGTIAAIEFGALQVPGITSAVAVEDTYITNCSNVYLYVIAGDSMVDAATLDKVRTEILNWKAAGTKIITDTATITYVDLALTIGVDASYDSSVIKEYVKNDTLAFVNALAIGGTLYPSDLETNLLNTIVGLSSCTVTNPAAALMVDGSHVIRTTLDKITVT